MKVNTRLFGEVEVSDDKIIILVNGLIGFPDMKKFTLIYDEEKKNRGNIMWLQSLDEPVFALPVMVPNNVVEDYNPTVSEELLAPLGEITEDNLYVLVTVKVPSDVKKTTINLKAPIVINTDTCMGDQLIVEDDLEVRFPVYDYLMSRKVGE